MNLEVGCTVQALLGVIMKSTHSLSARETPRGNNPTLKYCVGINALTTDPSEDLSGKNNLRCVYVYVYGTHKYSSRVRG